MRIAIPSDDGVAIATHTGRAMGFVIYDRYEAETSRVEFRKNPAALSYTKICELDYKPGDQCCTPEHETIWSLIKDCQVLIVNRAGPQFVKAMMSNGMEMVLCREENCNDAVSDYALGTLTQFDDTDCKHWYERECCPA